MSGHESDVDLYPQILEGTVWHRRPANDTGYGPTYPTQCGKRVRTFAVDETHGEPEEWQTRCGDGCYPKASA